jgi:hypothetical protein
MWEYLVHTATEMFKTQEGNNMVSNNSSSAVSVELPVLMFVTIYLCETSPQRHKQHGPLKCQYPTTSLHGVSTQKAMTCVIHLHFHEALLITRTEDTRVTASIEFRL